MLLVGDLVRDCQDLQRLEAAFPAEPRTVEGKKKTIGECFDRASRFEARHCLLPQPYELCETCRHSQVSALSTLLGK